MSVEFYSANGSDRHDASPQSATVGGSKPLHRFIRGQPKTIGIVVLILGASFFIVSISINVITGFYITQRVLVGILMFISGILFILTEFKPSKKTVAMSLAFSIMSILGAIWCLLRLIASFIFYYNGYYDYSNFHAMALAVNAIFTCYCAVAVAIFIVMSLLAGAALRSSNNQAVIMMTTAPTETPVE